MQKMLLEELEQERFQEFLTFHQKMRSRFARMFLFATQVCHLIVFVELSVTFDASLLGVFKALKIIRYEQGVNNIPPLIHYSTLSLFDVNRDRHVLKFFPKLLKNSSIGFILGKPARLCSPRVIFLFENLPDGHGMFCFWFMMKFVVSVKIFSFLFFRKNQGCYIEV